MEAYFSLSQREVLTPNDSTDLRDLELRIGLYEGLTNERPEPFDGEFSKYDLFDLLQRMARREAATTAPIPITSPGPV